MDDRYRVWMDIPQSTGKTPWTCIARGLTAEQAQVYRDTCLHRVSVEQDEEDTPHRA